jgi:2-polyprenyl-6-methoxyphenol hydroxylase-like FAD-dependent oxidoreductase
MTRHVVVVGAGPVGAVAALLLAGLGVAVTLVERNPSLTSVSHASTFHPATLDLLATMGIDLAADPDAVRVDSVQWRDGRGEIRAEVHYRLLDGLTAHPFRIHLEQQALLDRLAVLIAAEPGVDFRPGVTALDLNLDRPAVTVVSGGGRRELITADAVIGCDGAHSAVRRLAGIGFPVTAYPTGALRARTNADLDAMTSEGRQALSGLCYFRGGGDGLSALRMAGDTRLIVRTDDTRPARERVSEAVAAATPWDIADLAIGDIDSYRLRRGVVDSYLSNCGPVLVLGDAAHVMSTAGGLNMNSGIHDAFTVVPVLADWIRGHVDRQALAQAATARRRYVSEAVIPRSERRVAGLQDGDRDRLGGHLADVAEMSENPHLAKQFLIEASLLDHRGSVVNS